MKRNQQKITNQQEIQQNQKPIPLQATYTKKMDKRLTPDDSFKVKQHHKNLQDLHIIISPSNHIPSTAHSISSSSPSSGNERYQNSLTSPILIRSELEIQTPLYSAHTHHSTPTTPTSYLDKTNNQDLQELPSIKIHGPNTEMENFSHPHRQFNHLDWQEGRREEQVQEDEAEGESETESESISDQDEENQSNNRQHRDDPRGSKSFPSWKRHLQDREGSVTEEREPLVHYDHNDPSMDPFSYDRLQSEPHGPSLKRRQRRQVYGGGRLDWGGELEIWEVGLGVASDILSPAPLLIPHVLLLLGLPIGLPALFLVGFMAWFSQVVLVVCGRYVGGRTYAQIASAVLPDRWKGCNVWFGETIVELCRVFVAGGRGMVNMMIVSDIFSQLTRQYTPQASILYSRVFIIILVGLLSLIPNFLLPRRPIFLPASFPTLSRLPLLMTILWPISIFIISFRLRQLNKELGRKLPSTSEGDVYSEIMGGTIWGGFTILLFCLTTPQHTFKHFRSLKRINKPPGNTTHPMRPLLHNPTDELAPIPDPFFSGSNRSSLFSSYTLRRYSWESAAFLGVLYAMLICLSWGLVGYLGMENGGYEVNFLASLPSNDPWISTSRILLLIVLIPSIPLSLRPATTALFHLIRIPSVIHTASPRRKKLRSRGDRVSHRIESEWDDEDEDEPFVGKRVWKARLVTLLVWLGVAITAIKLGGSNGGEGSSVEILGCVGSTIIGGLLPAGFWIVLFHIRKARPILNINQTSGSISNRTRSLNRRPTSRLRSIDPQTHLQQNRINEQDTSLHESGNDRLLLIKEAQLQKRLSGRRIWQDIGVFGLLIPFCLVVFLKGLTAVSHETGPPSLIQ